MIEELETCPQCNCVVYAKDIREEPDPYASEINGDDTLVRQCVPGGWIVERGRE